MIVFVSPLKVVTMLILILIWRLVLSILVDIVPLFSMLLLKDYIKKVLERFNMHIMQNLCMLHYMVI